MNRIFTVFVLALSACTSVHHANQDSNGIEASVKEVKIAPRAEVEAHGKKWMVSTQGKYATQIANQVMRDGGSLMDAAIAASFAIGVERPQSTGIGGGGFLIYHEAKTGKNFVLDFRERAPGLASAAMYLDEEKKVIPEKSVTGSLAIGVPGLIKGLELAHKRWGKLPWAHLVKPAADLAAEGFPIYPSLLHAIEEEAKQLRQFNESRATFLDSVGMPRRLGEVLIQKNLAQTLSTIARNPEDFYRGQLAKRMVHSVKSHGGILTLQDLNKYQVKERVPLEADWMGLHIVSMPPPSSGGIHLIQILKMLENDPLATYGFMSPKSVNLTAQAMQQAFADRAKFLGDPDFVKVPSVGLLETPYLKSARAKMNETKARTMKEVRAGSPTAAEHQETSHLTLMDAEGNVIVTTQTINGYFGSSLVAEGTGIVLNNEMDDFSAKTGATNIFGATSTSVFNSVAPLKTPLSSMSPTLLLKDGVPVLALGAPGGTRIITSVAQTILNYFVYHQDLYTAIASPRIHQQWLPDELFIENQSVSPALMDALKVQGWKIKRVPTQSNVMAIAREGTSLIGVSDPRDIGTSGGE